MATRLRRTNQSVKDLGLAVNDLKDYTVAAIRAIRADLVSIAADSVAFATPALAAPGTHNDRSERTVTAANASSLVTSITLVNDLRGVYEFHRQDTLAHAAVDDTNVLEEPRATNLATAIDLANEIKAAYVNHRDESGVHPTDDAGNSIAASDATDQSSLNTLLNELKTDLNLHMAGGVVAKSLRVVPA